MCWERKPASYTERAQSLAAGLAEYKLPLQIAFIFSQELQRAAMSHSPGKTLARKKKKATSCYIQPLAEVEKLSNAKQLPLEAGDLLQRLSSFFFLLFYHKKVAEGKWQPTAPCFIVHRQRGFSSKSCCWFIIGKKEVVVTLGYQLMPNDWEEREGFQLKGQSLYVCSNQRLSQKETKGFWVGNEKVLKWFDLLKLQGHLQTQPPLFLFWNSYVLKDQSSGAG